MLVPYWHQHDPEPEVGIFAISASGHSSITMVMHSLGLEASPIFLSFSVL